MNILQFIKNFVLNINTLIGIIIGGVLYYTFSRSREGFQTTPTTTTSSPAACAMIKLIFESANAKVKKAVDSGDTGAVSLLQQSADSIKSEMQTMGCS